MNPDPFRPRHDPALTLYEAFQEEAKHRKGRHFSEWAKAEREAVWRAAKEYAERHAMKPPTLAQVEACERYAVGSIDYGAKWAYQLQSVMRSQGKE